MFPAGECEAVFADEGAGEGVVEGIVPVAAGTKFLRARGQVQCVAYIGQGVGGEVGADATGEREGVNPGAEGVQGGDLLEEFTFGADVVGE